MANWQPFVLKWQDKVPEQEELDAISRGLKAIDYDLPDVDKNGICAELRSPLCGVTPDLIVNILVKIGYLSKAAWSHLNQFGEIADPQQVCLPDPGFDLDNKVEYHEFMIAYLLQKEYGD